MRPKLKKKKTTQKLNELINIDKSYKEFEVFINKYRTIHISSHISQFYHFTIILFLKIYLYYDKMIKYNLIFE